MRFLLLAVLSFFLFGCKVATLYDNYGAVASIENGSFKDMSSHEEYSIEYATPQNIVNTNTPLYRLGIPTNQVKSITVVREVKSSSQGGTIFSAIGDAFIGTCRMAAGVF